jgi:protein TonB
MIRLQQGIWPGAIFVSLLLHVSLFVQLGSSAGSERETPVQQKTVTHLSFRSVTATLPQPQPVERPKPAVEANVAPSARVDEAPQQEKARARRVVPPVPQTVAEAQDKADEIPTPVPPPESAPGTATPPPNGGDLQAEALLLEQKRNEYLRRLMGHIESNKFYPQAARRRGLQAVVKISFELLADGQIRALRVSDGHKLLRSAAEEAVARALPMPKPPEAVETPLAINFSMAYQLL